MIDSSLLYQDNKSAILVAKNGRLSAGKASRHIHHRFFLIADKIKKGDVPVEHQGTKEMWADGNTEPLQGAGFRLFKSKIMGIPEDYDYDDEADRVRTHPLLLPKPKEAVVVPSADLQVLAKTLGVKGQDHEESTPSVTPAQPGRRSGLLDNGKFGP